MEQMEIKAMQRKIDEYIENLRVTRKFSDEILALIRSDLEFGLTKEQVQQYHRRQWGIKKMKVYSACLRNDYTEDVISVITQDKLTAEQMQVALEFYEKGVPLDTIGSVIGETKTAKEMQTAYQSFLEELQSVEEKAGQAPEYVTELVEQIKEAVEKIQYQEKRYDELNQKLKLIEAARQNEEELQKLEAVIENNKKEMEEMIRKIDGLETGIRERDERIEELKKMRVLQNDISGSGGEEKKEDTPEVDTAASTPVSPPNVVQTQAAAVPVYYTMPFVGSDGKVEYTGVERKVRKVGGVETLIGKLCFKRRSRQDIVKLVASGELVPAQLVQIKIGIEKGLTESQLVELINNNVSAEKMKEIIEIAVLENSLRD